jgi:hypothetical protein
MDEKCEVVNANYNLKNSIGTRETSIAKDPNVAKHMSYLYDKFVVSADKAANNIVFVCKSHDVDCLINELGIDNSLGNPTYIATTRTKGEIMDSHRFLLCSFGIQAKMNNWIFIHPIEFLADLVKGKVSLCHHLASVVRRPSSVNFSPFNLLL